MISCTCISWNRFFCFGLLFLSISITLTESSSALESTATEPAKKTAEKIDPHAIPLPDKLPMSTKDKSNAERDAKIESGEMSVASEPRPDWIALVDEMFGKYLVQPMAAVLFFDFGTKTALGVSIPFVVVWLLCGGVFLTMRMGFINLRGFWHAIELVRGKYDDKDHPGDVSHFQALSSALSGTVGLGNIAGVAIAIGVGGPGATFWMILSGFLGMTSKFAECTLALMYRSTDEQGLILGGPMVYLREGLVLAPLLSHTPLPEPTSPLARAW